MKASALPQDPLLPAPICARLLAHARAHSPQEACGLLLRCINSWYFRPHPNQARHPEQHFEIAAEAVLAGMEAEEMVIFHSHPAGPPWPSLADMRQQQETGHPWLIAALGKQDQLFWLGRQESYDLLDRPYRHGTTDCYGLIRDWYQRVAGISLPDFPRSWDWWQQGGDLYRHHFAAAGFYRLAEEAEKQPGDVFLARIRSPVVNHGGLLLENGQLLHHPAGSHGFDALARPRREPLGRWQKFAEIWLRHREMG